VRLRPEELYQLGGILEGLSVSDHANERLGVGAAEPLLGHLEAGAAFEQVTGIEGDDQASRFAGIVTAGCAMLELSSTTVMANRAVWTPASAESPRSVPNFAGVRGHQLQSYRCWSYYTGWRG